MRPWLYYFFILCPWLLIFSCTSPKDEINVTILLETDSLSPTEHVFITGNKPFLGLWTTDSLLMEKEGPNLWGYHFTVPDSVAIEYKFTKGAWDNEAIYDKSIPAGNLKTTITQDTTIRHKVVRWKDDLSLTDHVNGTVTLYPQMTYPGLSSRDVQVLLPSGYLREPDKKYHVLYVHDGQNVFNPDFSMSGFDWRVDEVSDSLARTGDIEPIIVVAISNSGERSEEYVNGEIGQRYIKFILESLKPMIDRTYRTTGRASSMGSSLGGLISFILAWEHPDQFESVACLSPAFVFPGGIDQYVSVVRDAETLPNIRVYVDNGGVDLDSRLQPGVDAMVNALEEKQVDHMYMFYPKHGHSERFWAARVQVPLMYMFGTNPQ